MFAEHFHRGGPLMYPIAVMSAIALALVFDRLMALRREILGGFFGRRSIGERLSQLDPTQVDWARFRKHPDPAARVLASYYLEGPEAARIEGNKSLQGGARGLGALDTIVNLSTNVGLLGTVIGVIGVFPHYISGDKAMVVKYLSVALYTTVGGLVVFLYGYIFLRIFRGTVGKLGERLELVTTRAEGRHAAEGVAQ